MLAYILLSCRASSAAHCSSFNHTKEATLTMLYLLRSIVDFLSLRVNEYVKMTWLFKVFCSIMDRIQYAVNDDQVHYKVYD